MRLQRTVVITITVTTNHLAKIVEFLRVVRLYEKRQDPQEIRVKVEDTQGGAT